MDSKFCSLINNYHKKLIPLYSAVDEGYYKTIDRNIQFRSLIRNSKYYRLSSKKLILHDYFNDIDTCVKDDFYVIIDNLEKDFGKSCYIQIAYLTSECCYIIFRNSKNTYDLFYNLKKDIFIIDRLNDVMIECECSYLSLDSYSSNLPRIYNIVDLRESITAVYMRNFDGNNSPSIQLFQFNDPLERYTCNFGYDEDNCVVFYKQRVSKFDGKDSIYLEIYIYFFNGKEIQDKGIIDIKYNIEGDSKYEINIFGNFDEEFKTKFINEIDIEFPPGERSISEKIIPFKKRYLRNEKFILKYIMKDGKIYLNKIPIFKSKVINNLEYYITNENPLTFKALKPHWYNENGNIVKEVRGDGDHRNEKYIVRLTYVEWSPKTHHCFNQNSQDVVKAIFESLRSILPNELIIIIIKILFFSKSSEF